MKNLWNTYKRSPFLATRNRSCPPPQGTPLHSASDPGLKHGVKGEDIKPNLENRPPRPSSKVRRPQEGRRKPKLVINLLQGAPETFRKGDTETTEHVVECALVSLIPGEERATTTSFTRERKILAKVRFPRTAPKRSSFPRKRRGRNIT